MISSIDKKFHKHMLNPFETSDIEFNGILNRDENLNYLIYSLRENKLIGEFDDDIKINSILISIINQMLNPNLIGKIVSNLGDDS